MSKINEEQDFKIEEYNNQMFDSEKINERKNKCVIQNFLKEFHRNLIYVMANLVSKGQESLFI